MANNRRNSFKNFKVVSSNLKTIENLMNGIYKSTYNTDRNSIDAVEKLSQDIEDNISSIISRNNMSDISNVGKLFTRMKLQDLSQDKKFVDGVNGLFEDPAISANLLSMYTENRWIRDLDMEFDSILRYMPRLREALEAKKENVLSSDNFAKDFLSESSKDLNDPADQAVFSSRMESLKRKYNSQVFFEEVYDNVAKYGEEFVYCVPYSKAITTLLKNKEGTRYGATQMNRVGYAGMLEGSVKEIPVIENGVISKKNEDLYETLQKISNTAQFNLPDNFKVIIDNRGILESAYNEYESAINYSSKNPRGVYESVLEAGGLKDFKFDETVPDELEVPKNFDKTSRDGFINLAEKNPKVKTPGCVLKRLKHENIIPIYIDDMCLGYYYIEFLAGSSYDIFVNNDHIYGRDMIGFTGVQPLGRNINFSQEAIEDQRNRLLSYFAGSLAQRINSDFVNNNQDLAKEIYNILKFNDVFNRQSIDSIRISFLPESDVEHIAFNIDPDTHRGLSDLLPALIPAKLYACLYITNTLGILTRGHDKRVYYVKQNVETNIAATMLNVINQIKKGNFGMREIENMNTILNITGRFNDFVIPVGPSGDAPIQFEVMPGQDFNVDNDLMERLEEMAINATGIPIEFIQQRLGSLDFAVQATSVNAKVLRSTYKRQSLYEPFMSRIQTKLYNTEYGENIKITCSLPAPLFLHMTNINQMIDNTKTYVQSIADYEYDAVTNTDENADAKKAIFIKNFMRKRLTSYLKIDEIEEMKNLAELEFNRNKNKEET